MISQVPNIFIDNGLQKKFDEDGFVKITLLTEKNISDLKQLYQNYFPNPSQDFFSSSYESDFSLKKEISNAIGKIMFPNLKNTFHNYTWFGSAFLSKGNGPRSEMPMHQDWTIVDENKYIALNIWTPLQNTDEENGTLEILKGSHKWHNTLRAPTLPFFYEGFQNHLKDKLSAIPAKAGEAIVLNQAVIHYSKQNKSNQNRIAITSGIKTQNAEMLFHYWDKNNPDKIEIFKQEDDFLLQFNDFHKDIFKRPLLGKSIGLSGFELQRPTEMDIQTILNAEQKAKKFATKIKKWLNY